MKTVKEISELTGISIRALRYYDEIGLLVPTERTNAGYRLYDDKALEKLRAILFLRELDIPLDTMKEVVNAKNCDYGVVLKNYRKNIVQKISRLQGLLGVVDGMEFEDAPVSFEAFHVEDAEKVTETIVSGRNIDDSAISEISELVKRLEDNTKKMYRTANARYILLKVAEEYLANDKTEQVLDGLYGVGVTATIGKAIHEYYGV